MLDFALELQHRYENSTSAQHRKQQAQVFTPPAVARFMARLFSQASADYRLLDPGAGIGMLTAAFCERLLESGSPRRLTSHLFESDPGLTPLLRRNLDNCQEVLRQAGHVLDYVVHQQDFILETAGGLDGQRTFADQSFDVRFDGVIMNPPYFKVRKESDYARLMTRIVHGQPNVYAFFMALAARLLKENGELVAITPRSFCNGLYFRGFRRWYLERMGLDHIHMFVSRTDTFKHSGVLQESMITKSHRLGRASRRIVVTTSFGQDLQGDIERSEIPRESIIDDSSGDGVIRIPGDSDDRDVMELVESLPMRFMDTGLCISTGPVVMFRATDYLVFDSGGKMSVPLLLPHNIKPFTTVWPVAKNGKPTALSVCEESRRLLLPVKNYVILKRFTAKEEKRRLTAGCLLREKSEFSEIAIENHLNYVYHADRELSDDETFGIAALFNSTMLDRYFRTISGNTQVNATEIRTMPFPDLKALRRIGKRVKHRTSESESLVLEELGVGEALRDCLVSN